MATLQRVDLARFVRLDANALYSLSIFQEESHPNVVSGKGRAKEGFSLFALMCASLVAIRVVLHVFVCVFVCVDVCVCRWVCRQIPHTHT